MPIGSNQLAVKVIAGVLVRRDPAQALPMLFDSPHSGAIYPDSFRPLVPRGRLRQAEDAFVDELYVAAPDHGATLIAAQFPRAFIDANRSLADLDPAMVEGGWPGAEHNRGAGNRKIAMGSGLIWRTHYPDLPLYERALSPEDVRNRIERYYRPYRKEVLEAYDSLAARFGALWHVNCHSMPSTSSAKSPEGPGVRRPDIVLGDGDGKTCEPAFTRLVRDVFADSGYAVSINLPYNGADLVRAHSDPARGRHSLQIEINRALYMDEASLARHEGFEKLRRACTEVAAAIAGHIRRSRVPGV